MKLLTITVPCYNSEDYMRRCIDSLLPGGEDVEIIIVNDGSTDQTGAIADEYAAKYPTMIRAVHQDNGGHGEGLNTGILQATGLYFKVVDSDDWVDPDSYLKILKTLRNLCGSGCILDMMISNFVYEKEGARRKKVTRYRRLLPENQLFDWSETRKFNVGKYILMHSVIYRTQLLRDCHLTLPKHTFYVDNLFVYVPLPYVKTMYYMDVDFYRYYIGREDQSVNEKVMIRRIDQQIKVNKLMVDAYDLHKITDRHLRRYMLSYLEIITVISTVLLIKSGTEENLEKKRELWTYIKDKDIRLFHHLRRRIMGQTLHLPGKGGRGIALTIYKISQKVIGFN
ncbi:MAG: glycosyltransferase family 2 protein [Clostridiales bacterium]|nr:glycosyltransferase family 2 protein [Clostridiales bacterium]